MCSQVIDWQPDGPKERHTDRHLAAKPLSPFLYIGTPITTIVLRTLTLKGHNTWVPVCA
jgi:hypothetical protein